MKLSQDTNKTMGLMCLDLIQNLAEIENYPESYLKSMSSLLRFSRSVEFTRWFSNQLQNYHIQVVKKTLSLRETVKKLMGVSLGGKPRFLLRVDDFPRWDLGFDKFAVFHEVLEKCEIPYLLAVTPMISLSPLDSNNKNFRKMTEDEVNLLHSKLIAIGLHGYTHQTVTKNYHTEFVGLGVKKVELKILSAMDLMRKSGLSPIAFVPPYNTIDSSSFSVISKYFKLILGGPESIRPLGLRMSPCVLNNVVYMPTYKPFYNPSSTILETLAKLSCDDEIIIPLTIHWSWEIHDNFKNLKMLCENLRGQTVDWNEFYEKSIQILAK
jgi:hypothetical protein